MRDITFWEEKLRDARDILLMHQSRLKECRRVMERIEQTCGRLNRCRRRRSLRIRFMLAARNRAHLLRRIDRFEKKIAFYESRIEARRSRTVWDLLRRPEV